MLPLYPFSSFLHCGSITIPTQKSVLLSSYLSITLQDVISCLRTLLTNWFAASLCHYYVCCIFLCSTSFSFCFQSVAFTSSMVGLEFWFCFFFWFVCFLLSLWLLLPWFNITSMLNQGNFPSHLWTCSFFVHQLTFLHHSSTTHHFLLCCCPSLPPVI